METSYLTNSILWNYPKKTQRSTLPEQREIMTIIRPANNAQLDSVVNQMYKFTRDLIADSDIRHLNRQATGISVWPVKDGWYTYPRRWTFANYFQTLETREKFSIIQACLRCNGR
jgi:hypothetical protein